MAWEKVKENRGSGGIDGQSLTAFEAQLGPQLARLQRELEENTYQPLPVRQHPIPKRDKPGEYRMLGIPAIYDRVCQQALLNRLEPIFEPVFDDASFGYRRGRSTKDALRKIWKEIQSGSEWIVDADLRDFLDRVPVPARYTGRYHVGFMVQTPAANGREPNRRSRGFRYWRSTTGKDSHRSGQSPRLRTGIRSPQRAGLAAAGP